MATRLQKDFGTATNNKIFTISAWIKRNTLTNTHTILCGSGASHARPTPELYVSSNGKIYFYSYNGSSYDVQIRSSSRLRDVNGWYHIVMAVDTTQATASDRIKIYVNGVQETFSPEDYPSQNFVLGINNNTPHCIGGSTFGSYGGGNEGVCMSHYHFIDGTAYDATAFGQTDANGVWTIKTSPSVTYGNNGFFILKDGNSVTDQSGNSNNFTVADGTLTNTEDNPSNVFATWNAIAAPYSAPTLSNGNTRVTNNGAAWQGAIGTIGVSSGKWYWEAKFNNTTLASNHGVIDESVNFSAINPMNATGYTGWFNEDGGEMKKDATDTTADYGTFGTNDIIGIALNMDNKQISIYKNGTLHVSNFSLSTTSNLVFPCTAYYSGGDVSYNFGNGYFGTTAVSSAGTNASGIGIFEYDVPTGFTALSTKGLNL